MNVKKTLLGLTIFGAGAGLGYFVCKKQILEQYKQDVSDVKQFYYNKLEELGVMEEGFDPSRFIVEEDEDEDIEGDEDWFDNEKEDEEWKHENEEYFNKVMKYSNSARQGSEGDKGRPIIKYNKPPLLPVEEWGDLEEDEDDDEEDEMDLAYEAELEARAEEFASRRYENKMNGKPYVIDYGEYQDGPDEYDRQFLYYYSHDRVLCEDNDDRVDDEEGLVGFDYEDVLEMQTTAWVRNDTLLTLYEIHRVDASYAITVENAVETPREREFRILGRRKQAMDE